MQGSLEKLGIDPIKAGALPRRRILLADSDPIFVHGLSTALREGFSVCGEVTTARECLASIRQVDILLMGFGLACGRSALGLLLEIRALQTNLDVIVLVPPTSAWMIPRLMAGGARGVLSRRTCPHELPKLLSDALLGREVPPVPTLSPREDSTPGSVDLDVLSARELEVFRLIGFGKSGREIAALLGISEKTVSSHRENIKAKLSLHGSGVLTLIATSHVHWEATGTDHTR